MIGSVVDLIEARDLSSYRYIPGHSRMAFGRGFLTLAVEVLDAHRTRQSMASREPAPDTDAAAALLRATVDFESRFLKWAVFPKVVLAIPKSDTEK